MLGKIWKFLASVRLTIYLLFGTALNLGIAALYLKFYPQVFRPLNKMAFGEWFNAYADGRCWWLVTLLFLLLLLGINTAACTSERIVELWGKRKEYSRRRFFFYLTPSLVHLFFLAALAGHALSLFTATHKEFPFSQGDKLELPPLNIEIKEIQPEFWEHPLIVHPLRQCTVSMDIHTTNKIIPKEIRFLHPFWFQGWSFHLDANPKAKPIQYILLVKKDPGTRWILLGGVGLSLLMLWYFMEVRKNKKEA